MSRIGKKIIMIPKGVEVKLEGNLARVKGPKGTLEREFHSSVGVKLEGDKAHVELKEQSEMNKRFHGLSRTLLANMVQGVHSGYSKSLTLVGVGYRAQMTGKNLQLNLGYSHPIDYAPPAGIEFKVDKQTTILVSGADKEMVGLVAAKIRGFRPPEPYHGKGVRYTEEHIATKQGKASGKK
jgi:large subunit ribosomal protein L6